MRKRMMFFMSFMAALVFAEIGFAISAVADGTNVTTQGIIFPDGSKQSTAARRWVTSILVNPKSTDTASGTALLNALSSITDASPSKPYLIIIEPGKYDIGPNFLQMKSYVDIQGSGENVTTITGAIANEDYGVVQGKSNAELRFLTVKNTGGFGSNANAIYNYNASPSLLHVTVEASGGTYNRGIYNCNQSKPNMTHVKILAHGGTKSYGVHNNWSSPTMNHVTVEASGATTSWGVYNEVSSNTTMSDVTVEGAGDTSHGGYGVYAIGYSNVRINHSVIDGYNNSIDCSTNGKVYVGNTQLKGGPVFDYNGSSVKCAGVYDEGYAFYSSTCP